MVRSFLNYVRSVRFATGGLQSGSQLISAQSEQDNADLIHHLYVSAASELGRDHEQPRWGLDAPPSLPSCLFQLSREFNCTFSRNVNKHSWCSVCVATQQRQLWALCLKATMQPICWLLRDNMKGLEINNTAFPNIMFCLLFLVNGAAGDYQNSPWT